MKLISDLIYKCRDALINKTPEQRYNIIINNINNMDNEWNSLDEYAKDTLSVKELQMFRGFKAELRQDGETWEHSKPELNDFIKDCIEASL